MAQTISTTEPTVLALAEPAIGIAAADDVTRRRITSILSRAGYTVAAESTTVDGLTGSVEDSPSHAVVITADQSERVALVRELRAHFRHTRIVLVSPPAARHAVRKAIDAGADGFVDDATLEQALVPTVAAVCAGQLVIPRELRAQIQKPALSYREKQVLGMVVMGFSNGEIASKLFLAESTVKSHLSSAFSKLGVRSRSEAAALILDPDQALGPGILSISSSS